MPDFLKNKDWSKFDIAPVTQEEIDRIEAANMAFFKTVTKDEFFKYVVEQDMLGYPVNTAKEIMEDEQLKSRGMWKEIEHEDLGEKITYPLFLPSFPPSPVIYGAGLRLSENTTKRSTRRSGWTGKRSFV